MFCLVVDRMFYALEMFCENLDDALLPYLQSLMEHLLPLVVPPHSVHVRELAISAIGASANAAKTNMLPYFETVMKHLQQYLTEEQTEETLCLQIQAPHYDDDTNAFPDYDDLSDSNTAEDDVEDIDKESDVSSDDVTAYTVVNAFVEEKEEACLALKEIAHNSQLAFLPFLHASFEETIKLLRFPHDYVKKAALEAVTQMVVNFCDPRAQQAQEVKREALTFLIPKLSEMVRTEEEMEVVMVALNSFSELLKEVGAEAIQGQGHAEAVLECVKDVMLHKTECQNDMDEGDEEEEQQAEQDEMLVESAGEIVPHLGKALGPEAFSYHYSHLLPLFQALTKKKCSDAQRSFGVGVIAECMAPLGERSAVFKDTLLPLLVALSGGGDERRCDDVRNNAIFALGELALHGGAALHADYPRLLHALSSAVAGTTHAATLDNIVAALARLIVCNVEAIPLDQVLPVYIQYLPLREDFEENKWIFKSFEVLYQKGADSLRSLLVPVIRISTSVLYKEQIEPENKDLVVNLLRQCHLDFPNDCVTAAAQMTQDEAEILRTICTS
ncbi:hypothetical protein LSTR_LSTR013097 [Laodelphax striatellus]|uniref:TOG domain-containing protein n=1 Tax=Laodelphax striatellus TaxID=195883 RepID=A0A482XL14_LAOST|nr:hypothetical protein LSTR_LSTR013097 [Laodelphax striatellus]